ncbi:unnamed protein product [Phaedon cochleariae]|uniref:Chitin-binding type-2 domain-containing protein n=1 Tax=Phaedon cochleariae TaxID=80249 RepID=A0A9P0GUM8_PHACE|nr:unnamed protein product [Phaedon cochleariae]
MSGSGYGVHLVHEDLFRYCLLWMYLLGFGFMALSLEPGFLDFDNLPDTNFTCVGKVIGGYYADLETNCQMFHVCTIGQLDEPMDIRFLCLNGTVFDQETRVCERIDEVDCTKSEQFYSLNLELYGNSQLSNLEENPETEQPLIIKSTPPSTTTPTLAPPRSSSRPAYFTTATPTNNPRQHQQQQQRLPSHHFPIVDSNTSPDIRFNPEEINISLNPGSPPNIRTNHPHPVSYYSDKKVIGTGAGQVGGASTGKSERGGYDGTSEAGDSYGDGEFGGYGRVTPRDVNFGFKFGELRELKEEEEEEEEDESEDNYRFQTQFKPSRQYEAPPHNSSPRQYTSSTYRNNEFTSPTTAKNYHHHQSPSTATTTTVRSYYPSPLTAPAVDRKNHYEDHSEQKSQYADHGERKSQYEDRGVPQRISLPLPTLTFSTPAPFSLQRRVEQKRYTKDHLPPPRIVISASASVSDASGRKLNYSLGTIDTSPLLKQPPATYDEYKDEDVVLDPFYIDVQKLKSAKRRKRNAEEEKFSHYDIIKNDEDAVRVLKFLFDWYRNEKTNPSRFTTPLTSQSITAINDELSPREATSDSLENDRLDFKSKSSDVFSKNSKYSLVGHEEVRKINDVQKRLTFQGTDDDEKDELFKHEEDYINDNYEPAAYDHKYGNHGFEYNDGKDSDERSIHEFVRLNEKAKNFSVPGDYVDDNIEPIYYRDQIDEYSKISEDFPVADHSENDTNELEQSGNVDMFTSTTPETTIPTTEIVETTEKSTTTTTSRSRSNRRRGRRKYQTESKDKEENKNAHIEKLIEKPYRAKDDYDYLRTVHIHTSSPKIATSETRTTLEESETKSTETPVAHTETPVASKEIPVAHTETPVASKEPFVAHTESPVTLREPSVALTESPAAFNEILVADTESPAPVEEILIAHRESPVFFEEIPVSDEAPSVSSTENTNPKLPDEVFDDVVMITTTTTTTESSRSRSSKRRRGKHKYQEETYQKKSQRRRKPPKPPEAEVATGQKISSLEYIGSSPGLSLEVSTRQSPAKKNLSFEVTPMENHFDLSVALETLPKSKPAKNRRGRMKFLNPIEDLTEHFREPSTESPARSTVLPAATWSQEVVLGTPNLSSTESSYQLNDSVPNESFPQATSTTLHENSTYAYSKLLEEVYATAFVPTIESVHITKKKQLKDNLLNSEFPTTESNLEVNTRRNTDTTEYYTQSTGDFWTTDLHTVIEAVESSTKSSFEPDLFTQITEGKDEVESTVEPMTSETTTLYKNHIFSKGMNLVSIVVEEESATDTTLAQSDFEMSTETFPVTQTSTQLEHKDITSTETPVVHTHTPFASTETPTTIPPPTPLVTSTSTDIDSTDTFPKTTNSFRNPSVSFTDISLAYRDTPVAHTETPVAFTGPPVASRIPPLGHSETPVVFENATVASKKTVTPIVLKETPVAPNGRHIASTETYPVREEKLVDSKEIPVSSEETPAAFKKSHVTSTEHIHRGTPVVFEVTPVASKETTVTFEEAYVTFTELPVASDTPVTHPKKPLASKGTPIVSKETHAIFTESVVTPKDPPVAFEETLVTSTETPVAHTEIPVHVETTTSTDYTQIPTTFEQTTLSSVEETTTDQSTTTKRPQRRRGGNPTRRKPTGYSRYKHRFVAEKETRKGKEFSTDFPLRKSVNPTQAERTLVTTPLSRMTVTVRKHFFFNCFGKEVDKFYADSRDCRLFHYCTQGYNENQLLDMKFVCDFNTFFDDEKLICTKTKPKRCL